MNSEEEGGHQGKRLRQALLMGGVTTRRNNQTPILRWRKRTNSLEQQGQSTRQRLLEWAPPAAPLRLIAPVERLSQFDIHGHNQQANDGEYFGDIFPEAVSPNSSLITFQNIGPQKKSAFHPTSQMNSRQFARSKAGVALYAEHCLNKNQLSACNLFNTRMKKHSSRSFSFLLNNTHEADTSGWHLVGGTGFSLNPLFTSHKLDHGGDITGLGRWSMARLQGRGQTTLCVLSAYCPVKNPRNPGSVWNQHCRYLSNNGIAGHLDPRSNFCDQLCAVIQARLEAGDSVILGMDHNEDVRTGLLGTRLKAMGLIDAILTKHSTQSPPVTFNRNTSRTPIDDIWVSANVDIIRAGYCPFGGAEGMRSDHRMLWIEVDNSSILGKYLPSASSTPRSGLRSDDPRARKRYTKKVHQEYVRREVPKLAKSLQEMVTAFQGGTITGPEAIIETYESLHLATTAARHSVEARMQCCFVGKVPWSPRLQASCDTIKYWSRIVQLRKGVATSRTTLKRLATKLRLYQDYYATLPSAVAHLKLAYSAYRKAKLLAPDWRDEHNLSLIEALVAEGKPQNKDVA